MLVLIVLRAALYLLSLRWNILANVRAMPDATAYNTATAPADKDVVALPTAQRLFRAGAVGCCYRSGYRQFSFLGGDMNIQRRTRGYL